MDIEQRLGEILRTHTGAPYLFVGSGLSRRYIGLEDWEGLLARFCASISPFGKYKSSAGGKLPQAASLMAVDFNNAWWSDSSKLELQKVLPVKDETSSLRYEISQYLLGKSNLDLVYEQYRDEVELLGQLNVDGVITTNWDTFLEKIFPDYNVYIGQSNLLFSSPISVAEIYKIHGCASQPESLVLTKSDYEEFEARNPYLAAKLITTFVDHPIVFLGYSISDENIQSLIVSISKCLDGDQIKKFGGNLIFVNRLKDGDSEGITPINIMLGDFTISCTQIKTDDFAKPYRAIIGCKKKIPAKFVRYFKEQMYEFVSEGKLEKRLAVANIDKIDDYKDVQYYVGVGSKSGEIGEVGYKKIGLAEIFSDYFSPVGKFDADQLLRYTVPELAGNSVYFPVFKYLRGLGIEDRGSLLKSPYAHCAKYLTYVENETVKKARQKFEARSNPTHSDLINNKGAIYKIATDLMFYDVDGSLKKSIYLYLEKNMATLTWARSKGKKKPTGGQTDLRRLACYYDRIMYGFE